MKLLPMAGAAMLIGMFGVATVQASTEACGSLQNHYGPFDYRTQRDKLARVEQYHFTPVVEALIRGQSTSAANGYASDISYLMNTSPNHHRGLAAIIRLVARDKVPQPVRLAYSIDCYFDRAIRFAPDDAVVRMFFAQYLQSVGKTADAKQQLKVTAELAKDNPLTQYNLGMLYTEVGDYPEALKHAHIAMSLGMQRPELADRLRQKGQWRDPEVAPAVAPPEASASQPGTPP